MPGNSALIVITILILGPGYPPNQRHIRYSIQKLIHKTGKARVIIMEKLDLGEKKSLHEAYHEMLDKYAPDLIVALYTKKGFSNAVDFEIGALTCRDPPALDRLFIMIQNNANEKRITQYVRGGLFKNINFYRFKDAKHAAEIILRRTKFRNKGLDVSGYKWPRRSA